MNLRRELAGLGIVEVETVGKITLRRKVKDIPLTRV